MSGNLNENFGSSAQAITCTINSLANAAARASTAIDNTSNAFIDALVNFTIVSAASATSATGHVDFYAVATVDGGSTYGEGATGSDAAITLTAPTNATPIGSLNVVANATTYHSNPFSIAAAFGGVLPAKWVVIVVNNSGATLASSGCSAQYQGVFGQYT